MPPKRASDLQDAVELAQNRDEKRLEKGRWVCVKDWDGDERLSLVYYLSGWTQAELDVVVSKVKPVGRETYMLGSQRFFKGHTSGLGIGKGKIRQKHWWAFDDAEPSSSVAQQWSSLPKRRRAASLCNIERILILVHSEAKVQEIYRTHRIRLGLRRLCGASPSHHHHLYRPS